MDSAGKWIPITQLPIMVILLVALKGGKRGDTNISKQTCDSRVG
jgi:hypothetical protein